MGAMNVNGCRGRAQVAQITSKSVSSRTKILFDEQWEDALRQDLTPKLILVGVTLERKQSDTYNFSQALSGANTGWQAQTQSFFIQRLYLNQ